MRKFIKLIAFLICMVQIHSCDVHEFPEKEYPFVLHLDYNVEMPFYKLVEIEESPAMKSLQMPEYDVRYMVNVYDAADENTREVLYTFTFTKDNISSLDTSVTLLLPAGNYRFLVWSDYVNQGSEEDLYYCTDRFEYISLPEQEHSGSNDMRDAFAGNITGTVSEQSLEATVPMSRPMAKFNFITTDLADFLAGNVALEGCKIVFKYNGFMPCAYNMHTSKPTDSRTGTSFSSNIRQINENEAELGFDYVFVNGDESKISVYIEVYDAGNTLLSTSKPVEIPLMRSKLTTVKAKFLTTDAGGGVVVSPGYDDDHNILI